MKITHHTRFVILQDSVLARRWALLGIEPKNFMESGRVLAMQGHDEANPHGLRQTRMVVGDFNQCARRESNLQPSASEADAAIHKPLDSIGNSDSSEKCMARNGALLAQKDARLAELIDRWESLPESIRVAIMAVAGAAVK